MAQSIKHTASVAPIDLESILNHSRIDQLEPEEEANLRSYLIVATEMVEQHLGRFLLSRTVEWSHSADLTTDERGFTRLHGPNMGYPHWAAMFQRWVQLPYPASCIEEVTMGLYTGEEVTLEQGQDYQANLRIDPARIRVLRPVGYWMQPEWMTIKFTSGFGDTPASIPEPIIHAIRLLVTNLYQFRGDTQDDIWTPATLNLLANYRLVKFG